MRKPLPLELYDKKPIKFGVKKAIALGAAIYFLHQPVNTKITQTSDYLKKEGTNITHYLTTKGRQIGNYLTEDNTSAQEESQPKIKYHGIPAGYKVVGPPEDVRFLEESNLEKITDIAMIEDQAYLCSPKKGYVMECQGPFIINKQYGTAKINLERITRSKKDQLEMKELLPDERKLEPGMMETMSDVNPYKI